MWVKYDKDGNGSLEYDELKKFAIETLKKIKGGDAPVPTEEEMLSTFQEYDKDGNGSVTKAEMAVYIRR